MIQLKFKHQNNIQSVKSMIEQFKSINTEKLEQKQIINQPKTPSKQTLINVGNYRTVPCKNYHGPQGCTRGEFCHFIHVVAYDKQPLPRDVFQEYRNENMRKNMLDAIKAVNESDC